MTQNSSSQNIGAASHLDRWMDILSSPGGGTVCLNEEGLLSSDGTIVPISPSGIPLYALTALSSEASFQQQHYDKIAAAYVANLSYPHTQEYMAYLDRVLLQQLGTESLGTVAELCCGRGEGLTLPSLNFERYVGIDISRNMLESGRASTSDPEILFAQGDVTRVPIKSASIDTVLMLGGIHHISDRESLFSEISRILKPGGRFVFREPVSDFFLWKMLRWVIYRVSPMLDHETEAPLTHDGTALDLQSAGLRLSHYRTCGFLGFCLFMNSDVLVVNRLFRFIPGIRHLTRWSASLDNFVLSLPGMRRAGLQVVGEVKRSH